MPPDNILSGHFEKYVHDMDLKAVEHIIIIIIILIKKPGEIPIFGTFLAKNSILAYILLNIDIFISP